MKKKSGIEDFENLYILTYSKIYKTIYHNLQNEELSKQTLKEIFLWFYHNKQRIPENDAAINWMVIFADKWSIGVKEEQFVENDEELFSSIEEEEAFQILSDIEDELELYENEDGFLFKTKTAVKFMGMIAILIIALFTLIKTFKFIYTSYQNIKAVNVVETTEEVSGWIALKDGTRYKKKDDTFVTDTWFLENEKLYHFNDQGYMDVGEKNINNCFYVFGTDGVLKKIRRSGVNQLDEKIFMQKSNGFTYFLRRAGIHYNLFRTNDYNNANKPFELLIENIDDYFVYDHMIFYMYKSKLMSMNLKKNNYFKSIDRNKNLDFGNDGIYIIDDFGNRFDHYNGTCNLNGYTYKIKNGMVVSVISKPELDEDVVNKIYEYNGKLDSCCKVGDFVYFSVCDHKYDGENDTGRVYKMNITTFETEECIKLFEGSITNMFYDQKAKCIYGEYKENSDYDTNYIIQILCNENSMGLIEDDRNGENRCLSIVGSDDQKIYCISNDQTVILDAKKQNPFN